MLNLIDVNWTFEYFKAEQGELSPSTAYQAHIQSPSFFPPP